MRDRKRYDWEDDLGEGRAFARKTGWSVAQWILVIVTFSLILGGIIWGLTVLVSGPKGAGDATKIVNDGQNRVNAQEEFHALYNGIIATDKKITFSAQQLDIARTERNLDDIAHWRSTLSGQQNVCLTDVGIYNTKTDQISRGRWRDDVLPYKIDTADPATDCQPTVTATAVPTN